MISKSGSHGILVPNNYQLRPLLTTFLRHFSWTYLTWDLGIPWVKIRILTSLFKMKIIRYPYPTENLCRSLYDVEHFEYLSTVCIKGQGQCSNLCGQQCLRTLLARTSGGAWRTSDSIFWQDRYWYNRVKGILWWLSFPCSVFYPFWTGLTWLNIRTCQNHSFHKSS